MRALHIMDHMDLGGAQLLVKGIFEKYQNQDLYLFTMRSSNIKIDIDNVNYFISKSQNVYSFKPLFEIIKIIKKHDIKIIHCYLLKSQIFGWIIKTFFLRQTKLVFHEVGEILMNDRFAYKKFMKIADKKVSLYFAASKATKDALIKKVKALSSKIHVLYNYVLLENFTPEKLISKDKLEKSKFNINSDDLVLGYAGRLSKEKACEYLIKSLPYFNIPVKVLIAGTGNEEEKLIKLAKELGVEEKVIFMGFVKNIIEFYSLIDIHVIPSVFESFGLIAIEAQALGKPVVASDIPGLNEVVIHNDTGMLFKAKNPEDLAEKVIIVNNNSDLRNKIIRRGFENADKYGIENYYYNMIEAYKKI